MSAINVNSITGRTGLHGPVLTGVSTAADGFQILAGEFKVNGISTFVGMSTFNGGISVASGLHADDDMYFRVNGAERLRITSDGKIGINATSPGGQLCVTDASTYTVNIGPNGGDGALVSTLGGSASLALGTDSIERVRITSDGQVLANTTTSRSFSDNSGNGPTPIIQIEATNSSAMMSIVAASTADSHRAGTISLGRHRNTTVGETPTLVNDGDTLGAICFSGGDGSDMLSVAAHIRGLVDGTPGSNDMPGALSFSTTPDGSSSPYLHERLRITSAGIVGINKSSPSSEAQLDIVGSSYWPILVKTTSVGGGGVAIKNKDDVTSLYVGSGGSAWATGSAITDGLIRAQNNLIFASNGNNERLRIASDGKVLVSDGTNWAAYVSDANLQITDNTNAKFVISNPGNRTYSLAVGTDDALAFKDESGSAERMRITSAGKIILPTGSPGIQFGSTDSAGNISSQTLDDYEEGTWTPTNAGGTVNSGTWAASGWYTKIGNMVTVQMAQTGGNISWSAGAWLISGLPFAAPNPFGPVGVAGNTSPDFTSSVMIWTASQFYLASAGSNQTSLRITITYRVD